MADRELTPDETEKLLGGTCLANLATVNRDGSPQVTPVWYGYRDGKFMIITHDSVLKTRNIRRDPRVSVSIATPDVPYAYLLAQGKARVTSDDLETIVTSICVRYWGDERGQGLCPADNGVRQRRAHRDNPRQACHVDAAGLTGAGPYPC